MGLFGKKKLTSLSSPSSPGGVGGRNMSRTANNNEDPWIPVAIEFATQDDELLMNNYNHQQQNQEFNDSFISSNSSTGGATGIVGSESGGIGGISTMTGRGINSREISPPQGVITMIRRGVHDMVGTGINSRLSTHSSQQQQQQHYHHAQYQQYPQLTLPSQHQQQPQLQQQQQAPPMSTTNPFLVDEDDHNISNNAKKKNPFHYLEYADSSSSDASGKKKKHSTIDTKKEQREAAGPTTSATSAPAVGGEGGKGGMGLQQFEDSVKLMEEKLKSIDNTKFLHFDHHTSTDDDNDNGHDGNSSLSKTTSSGEEDTRKLDGSNRGERWKGGRKDNVDIITTKKQQKSKSGVGGGGATGLIKMFGKKKKKMRLRRQHQQQQQSQREASLPPQSQPRQYHRPIVDSDNSSFDDDDTNSHVSGEEEYNKPFRNAPHLNSIKSTMGAAAGGGGGGIGVPNGKGSQLTTSQVEDELYRYKLETLNLTDACRDLLEQLEEVEDRLGTVQAQATFRIHALEAELQDNTLGLKSLVKMTSTEMDGRLEALRAVSKTMAVQAARLKERDGELVHFEQRMRSAQRDFQRLKRENKMNMDEKKYLKMRLDELNQAKYQLEEDMKLLAMENSTRALALTAEEQSKIEEMEKKLRDTLEHLEYVKSELECKDTELIELVANVEEKDGEVLKMRQELDIKEHAIDRLEVQLEKVRKDLLYAATTARAADEARVEAEERETIIRSELETALGKMESHESELKKQIESAEDRNDALTDIEALRVLVAEAQKEVEVLREEKEAALAALSDAHTLHDRRAAILEAEINSLNKDVDVHREQMELAQTMLEEKETLASELRTQLEDAMKDEVIQVLKLEKQLASMNRDVNKVTIELVERNNYIAILENKLETARKEFLEHRTEIETTAIVVERSVGVGDDDVTVQSSSTVPLTAVKSKDVKDHLIMLAEKDSQIDCLEREIRTSKLKVEQLSFELDEKDAHADYLTTELERRKAKMGEVEAQLDEKNKSLESLRMQLNYENEAFNAMCEKLTKLENDLSIAVDSAEAAEDAHQHATSEMEAAKAARQEAIQVMEKLKILVEQLENRSASAVAEVEILKSENEKERNSSMQAAATLAATNAARQVEMEMTIEKLQKEIDSQRHEIDAIQSELKERDETADRLSRQLHEAREDLVNHKRGFEAEREKIQAEKEKEVLQRVADRDYFDEDDVLSLKSNSSAEGGGSNRGKGLLGGLFQRSSHDIESENFVDWKVKAREKDARISQLEKSLADNSLSLCNLRNELVTVTSKFKEDESQRRLLIQRLENENQAYSRKLEALELDFGGSAAMGMSMTDMTTTTATSQQTLTERENARLKKQKRVYEARIDSLQTQLSEIQQIVPELMSKSKLQIQKLENVIEHQRQETKENEQEREQEVAQLREQNEQLQAATRSILQASDVGRQDEIDELRLRLEAREATIKKLEAMAASGGSIRNKDGRILRKKKKKVVDTNDNDGDISVLSVSTWGTEQQI